MTADLCQVNWALHSDPAAGSNRAEPLQVHGFVYGEQVLTPPKRITVTGFMRDIATGDIDDLKWHCDGGVCTQK